MWKWTLPEGRAPIRSSSGDVDLLVQGCPGRVEDRISVEIGVQRRSLQGLG